MHGTCSVAIRHICIAVSACSVATPYLIFHWKFLKLFQSFSPPTKNCFHAEFPTTDSIRYDRLELRFNRIPWITSHRSLGKADTDCSKSERRDGGQKTHRFEILEHTAIAMIRTRLFFTRYCSERRLFPRNETSSHCVDFPDTFYGRCRCREKENPSPSFSWLRSFKFRFNFLAHKSSRNVAIAVFTRTIHLFGVPMLLHPRRAQCPNAFGSQIRKDPTRHAFHFLSFVYGKCTLDEKAALFFEIHLW